MSINSNKTPQERLEIREFILDSNLHLISNGLYMVSLSSLLIYYTVLVSFCNGYLELYMFISTTVIFIFLSVFAYLGYKSIQTQKKYISRLDTVFENIDDEKEK